MSNGRPRAYTNAIVSMGSTSRAVVRFTCVDCSHELELANNDPRKHGSFFAQQAKRRGWDTDGCAINRVFCPDCRKTPAYRSRRQIELDSVVLPALGEPPVIEGVAEPVSITEQAAELAAQATKALRDSHSWARENVMARELSNEQRRQIRLLLDQFFDDKEGCYLVGEQGEPMSDQEIGSLAGVPWGEVTKIREASYGRIMVDPAMAALRGQMDELQRRVLAERAAMEEALRNYVAATDQRLNEMRTALDGYGRRLAVKAS